MELVMTQNKTGIRVKLESIDGKIYKSIKGFFEKFTDKQLNVWLWFLATPMSLSIFVSLFYGMSLILMAGIFMPILIVSEYQLDIGALTSFFIVIVYHLTFLFNVWITSIVFRLTLEDEIFDTDKMLHRAIIWLFGIIMIMYMVSQYYITGKLF